MTKIDLTPEAVERLAKRVSPVTDDVRTVTVFAATSREVAATLRALSARLAEVEEALKLNQDLDAISVDAVSNLITRAEAAEAKLAKAVEALRFECDYWIKRADADLADQAMNERFLDYPTQRKMTEAMTKADALVASLAKIGGDA